MSRAPHQRLAKAHGVRASFVFYQSDAARLSMLIEQIAAARA